MSRSLFLFLFVFLLTRGYSQVIQPVPSLFINDLTFSDENFGIAAGSQGRILITSDGGKYWKLLQPEISQKRNLTTTYIAPFGHIYVGGAKGLLMKSTDQGQTWTSINLPITTTLSIQSIGFFNPQTGIAVLEEFSQSEIYITRDGGQNWARINMGDDIKRDIMILDDTTAICLDTHRIMKTTNRGLTWQTIADNGLSYLWFVAGDFLSDTLGYIMEGSIPWKTTDGGKTWTKLNTVSWEGDYYDLDFITEQVGFYSSGYGIYKTINGGQSWTKIFNQPANFRLAPFHFFNESKGIVSELGNTRILLNTENSGVDWNVSIGRPGYTDKIYQSAPGTDYKLPMNSFLHVQSETELMMVNRDSLLWYSDNGGVYFYHRTVGNHDLNSIYFVNNQLGFVAGEKGAVYKTTDAGQTWQFKSTGTTKDLLKISFSDSQQGIATGNQGAVLVTENGGETWQDVSVPDQNFMIPMGGILNANQLYAGTDGGVYTSNNRGASWSYYPKPWNVFQLTDVNRSDAQNFQFLYGDRGSFGYSTDGGPTTNGSWLYTISGANLYGSIGYKLSSMDFRGDIGFAAGYRYITRTGDLGKNWTVLYIGSDATLEAIRMLNDTIAFAYGEADWNYQNLYKISCDVSAVDVVGEFSGVCDKEYTYSLFGSNMNTASVQATYTITGGTVISQTENSIKIKWNLAVNTHELRAKLVAKNCKTVKEIVRSVATVDQLPETIEIHGKRLTCAGEQSYEVLNYNPNKAYVWSITNGNGAQILNPDNPYYKANVRWTNATTATLNVTIYSDGCTGKIVPTQIKVVTTPPAKIATVTGQKEICSTEATQQYSVPAQDGVTYQWVATGGTVINTSNNKATIAWDESGLMSLSVTPFLACLEGESTTIDIARKDKDWFEDADGDGFGNPVVSQRSCGKPVNYVDNNLDCDDTDSALTPENNCVLVTGVEKDASGKLIVYPNPCAGLCRISSTDDISHAELADSQGRKFDNIVFRNGSVDVSPLASGLYVLTITRKNGQTSRTKLLVAR